MKTVTLGDGPGPDDGEEGGSREMGEEEGKA